MLKWLLILSVTLVSTTMLMFLSAYIAILNQSQQFFGVQRSQVLLLSNSFNIFYLIISPLIFSVLNKYYLPFVRVAVIATAVGAVGRYLLAPNYTASLIMSFLVAIAHVPIITAPYGLLKLFAPEKRGYAASIPLFVPALGINFCILYGMTYIASGNDKTITAEVASQYIHLLNLIIAISAVVSMLLTLFFLSKLQPEILKISSEAEEEGMHANKKGIVQNIKEQTKTNKRFLICIICWGIILGINWTYGGMFGVIFENTRLSEKQIALLGLMANVSSAIFSNLGTWIVNNYQLTHLTVIFLLNILGFLASLFIQASSGFNNPLVQNMVLLCFAIVILRAGFSSFVSLALLQLQRFSLPSVVVSCIFFWIANGSNLIMIYITDWTTNQFSLAVLSLVVWICMFIVHFAEDDEQPDIETAEKNMDEEALRAGSQSIMNTAQQVDESPIQQSESLVPDDE